MGIHSFHYSGNDDKILPILSPQRLFNCHTFLPSKKLQILLQLLFLLQKLHIYKVETSALNIVAVWSVFGT